MNAHQVFFLISSLTILLKINCYGWVIPMEKFKSDLEEEEVVDAIGALEKYENGASEDPKAAIGIKIVKLTRQDPIMQIFDFNMDLARKFAYKEWQTLLSVYVPVIYADTEEYTVELPARQPPKIDTQAAQSVSGSQENGPASSVVRPNLEAKKEYDEDAPQLVAQTLKDVRSNNLMHGGLK